MIDCHRRNDLPIDADPQAISRTFQALHHEHSDEKNRIRRQGDCCDAEVAGAMAYHLGILGKDPHHRPAKNPYQHSANDHHADPMADVRKPRFAHPMRQTSTVILSDEAEHCSA